MSKLIVIEGTDCSGKRTQTDLLYSRLKTEKFKIEKLSFPMYDTPTGKIIGGPYLGIKDISEGYFSEGANKVDPKVASLYFAADRKYNVNKITDLLNKDVNVLLDRYVESNMGHQGGKLKTAEERKVMYKWLDNLEYNLLDLPRPDLTIFLYLPYQYASELNKTRLKNFDQHENNIEHLLNAEQAYLELVDLYGFKFINCVKNGKIKTEKEIHEELYLIVKQELI